jgi:cob(I)alamin adenosyltransferase
MPRDPNEPVRLTRIYTRGGDRGETSLGDGSRVSKLDLRIAASGMTDELNSIIGYALSREIPEEIRPLLEQIQNELFDVGADLSVPFEKDDGKLRATEQMVDRVENLCDEFNADLSELKSFVLPGGTEAASLLHIARSVARRAELKALEADVAFGVNPVALVYLNRLSDLLFILSRWANLNAGANEPLWRPGSTP